jgi:transposase
MPKPLVTDAMCALVEPLLPPEPKGGRPHVESRATLTGILFVLKSGIPWETLPQEMGCGSGMTCWRRLKEWHEAGVWDRLHRALLDRLGKADRINWQRASLDSASAPAPGGREDRPQPDGSRQTGLETPPHSRRRRCPACANTYCRQRPRLEGLRGTLDRPKTGQTPRQGTSSKAPREAARRHRLRLSPLPPSPSQTRHQ